VIASQQVVSDTEILLEIEATYLEATGQLEIAVINPAPGGGSSDPIRIDVEDLPARPPGGSSYAKRAVRLLRRS
jgi:hypothetical protein